MRHFLIRWLIYVLSLALAARLVDGVDFPGDPPGLAQVLAVAALFGVLNAVVKPLLQMASCFLYVATLGLFHFVLNAGVLMLTGWLAGGWLVVTGFWPAFQASLIISLTSTVLGWLLDLPKDGPPPPVVRRAGGVEVIDAVYEKVDPPHLDG